MKAPASRSKDLQEYDAKLTALRSIAVAQKNSSAKTQSLREIDQVRALLARPTPLLSEVSSKFDGLIRLQSKSNPDLIKEYKATQKETNWKTRGILFGVAVAAVVIGSITKGWLSPSATMSVVSGSLGAAFAARDFSKKRYISGLITAVGTAAGFAYGPTLGIGRWMGAAVGQIPATVTRSKTIKRGLTTAVAWGMAAIGMHAGFKDANSPNGLGANLAYDLDGVRIKTEQVVAKWQDRNSNMAPEIEQNSFEQQARKEISTPVPEKDSATRTVADLQKQDENRNKIKPKEATQTEKDAAKKKLNELLKKHKTPTQGSIDTILIQGKKDVKSIALVNRESSNGSRLDTIKEQQEAKKAALGERGNALKGSIADAVIKSQQNNANIRT